jgi:hypothetical protein
MLPPSLLSKIAPKAVYVPLSDACRFYGVSDSMLRRLCRSGYVDAVKAGRSWLVNLAVSRKQAKTGPRLGGSSKQVSRVAAVADALDACSRGFGGVAPMNSKSERR